MSVPQEVTDQDDLLEALEKEVADAQAAAEFGMFDPQTLVRLARLIDQLRSLPETQGGMLPLSEVIHRHIMKVLADQGGKVNPAARILGIGRSTLYHHLARRR